MVFCGTVTAQRITSVPENVMHVPIDTLDTGIDNRKVVIYTDNVWEYYYPDLQERLAMQVYNDHWVNDQIFAYRDVQVAQIPQTVELDLISNRAEYHAPAAVGKVYSKYGNRGSRRHQGVDLQIKYGDPVYAAFDGKVRYSAYNSGGYGNLVIIRHENGLETWYAHLSGRAVEVNDFVSAGTVIGYGGSTGRSKSVHLHFEVRYCDQSFDPEHLIDFSSGNLRCWSFPLQKSYFGTQANLSEILEEPDFDEPLLASETSSDTGVEAAADTPKQEKHSPNPTYHNIRKGDTLSKIARQYGTSVKKLCQLNNMKETTVLHIGRKLRVR